MTSFQKISLALLRVSLGWLFFYAGITKVLDPTWSAAGYINAARTFSDLYRWFTMPSVLPTINFLNEWGLTLLGVSLIFGIFVRLSSVLGAMLMLLYYFPILSFPYIPPHSYIVDEHIVYAISLLVLASMRAGRVFGLESWCADLPICSRFPVLRSLLG